MRVEHFVFGGGKILALSLRGLDDDRDRSFHFFSEPWSATGQEFLDRCHVHGIDEAITSAMLSSSDLSEACDGSSEATLTFAAAAQAAAKELVQGWARGSNKRV